MVVVESHLVVRRVLHTIRIDFGVVDRLEIHDLVRRVVEAGRFIEIELRRCDLGDQDEVVLIALGIAHRPLGRKREIDDVSGLDIEPLPAEIDLSLPLEADHRLLGHVVGPGLALLSGLERQHVHRFGQEAVARPGDRPGVDAVRRDRDAVAQVADRSVLLDLRVRQIPFPIALELHGSLLDRSHPDLLSGAGAPIGKTLLKSDQSTISARGET